MKKCRYSHCKHETPEIRDGEGILVGKGTYYHEDCYEEMTAIKNIIDVYVKRVDPHPIMALLRRIVNEIVYNQKVNAKYLLFALNYSVDHGWRISRPQGLYYVAKNNDAKRQWEKNLVSKQKREIMAGITDADESVEEDNTFEYQVQKAVGFGDVLR